MYDVVVIGAGPAGSTAAKTLAENGYTVLLVEKYKLPRYKSCSGQLIKKSVDLIHTYFGEPIPDFVMCTPTENKGMIFTNDKGNTFRFEQTGCNVWRNSFDKWLVDLAAKAGVCVMDNTTAVSVSEHDDLVTVTLKNEQYSTIQAKYVLDCEGVAGIIKRTLLNRSFESVITYQTFNQGSIDLDYHFFHAFLQPEFSEYDAWFNVKDNMLVLGVAVKDGKNIEHYYSRFIAYLKEHHNLHIEKEVMVDKWLMPHIRPGCRIEYGVGRVLFAGDAAGFLNPMGEGISSGLESGYSAAMSIMKYFENVELVHAEYRKRTKSLHEYMKRQWNFVASMAETFSEMKMQG